MILDNQNQKQVLLNVLSSLTLGQIRGGAAIVLETLEAVANATIAQPDDDAPTDIAAKPE